jgi:hypothetical protein
MIQAGTAEFKFIVLPQFPNAVKAKIDLPSSKSGHITVHWHLVVGGNERSVQ